MAWWLLAVLLIAALDVWHRFRRRIMFRPARDIWRVDRKGVFRYITPRPGSEAYGKQKKLIERARLDITVEGLQALIIMGLVLGLAAGAAVVHTNIRLRVREVYSGRDGSVLSFVIPQGTGGGAGRDNLLQKLTAEAAEAIDYGEYVERGELGELKEKVYAFIDEKGVEKEYASRYADKVRQNLIALENARLGRNDVLVLVIFGCIGMLLPGWILKVREKRTLGLMEYELGKLEIITILLLQKENINISGILMRLKAASDIYRPYLSRCLAAYPGNPHKALSRLQDEVAFRPFTDFINVLKQGIDSDRETTGRVLDMTRRLKNSLQEAMERQNIRKAHRNIQLIQYPMVAALLAVLLLPWLIIFRQNI